MRPHASVSTALAAVAGLVCGALPSVVIAQTPYATPVVGWSEHRGPVFGGRVGAELVGGLDVLAQIHVFFPDESGVADPGVLVARSAWHVGVAALYVFDRSRWLSPYAGAGGRRASATLTLTVDGLRAREHRSGFDVYPLGGVRFPHLPGQPFAELEGGDGGWTLTAGARWVLAPR